jgi:hypothetical protein
MSGGHVGQPLKGGALTFDQIAARLGISKREAEYAFHSGLAKLRRKQDAVALLTFYSAQLQIARQMNARKVA